MVAAKDAKENNKRKYKGVVHIRPDLCKGCEFCIEFCPTHVLVSDTEFNSKGYHPPVVENEDACTGCDLCGLFCPDFAIFAVREVSDSKEGKEEEK